jgi:hypothetical protein
MLRFHVPLLVTVSPWPALVVPTSSLVKLKLEPESETAGATPVPERVTACGLFAALSLIESVAVRLPVAEGVNVTLIAQLLLGVTVAPVQVSVFLAKSLAFVPPIVAVEMLRFAVPLLVTVSPWPALVVPTSSLVKLKLEPESETAGAIPVPERDTACGLFAALSLIESVAVRIPVAEGVNVTLIAQVLLGVTVAPVQVSELLAKSLAFAPPIVTVETLRFPVPLLVTVRPWAALAVPTS